MSEKDIQEKLQRHFSNYEYELLNSFVFEWECDFFCQSTSGYFVETEVKVTRSDFFKDFEKDKHKIFMDLSKGKTVSVYKNGNGAYYHGDVIIKNFQKHEIKCRGYRMPNHYLLKEKHSRDIVNGGEELVEPARGGGYMVNDWQDRLEIEKPRWRIKDVHAPVTNIGYHKLTEINIPNQFYYAVPKGLIKLKELPPYAGLIEISHYAELTKKAPYMHKRKMDLDKILLKKFYNLWKYKGKYIDVAV